jgi:membrane associated rhomboid family serine protease
MLPLRDNIPSSRVPWVTLLLIALNALAFLWELKLGQRLGDALDRLALIPIRYTNWDVARHFHFGEQVLPFFSSMFLHGGWLHLLGNMWTLWIFGDNVEDRLGPRKYLVLYLGGGITAGLLHVYTNPHSAIPTLGASGAVAAVMGAYLRFFPHARVETIIPPFFWGPVLVLPAMVFLGIWFLLQFFSGALSLAAGPARMGGVAWWAHVGGFLFGIAGAMLAGRRQERSRRSLVEW